jgi:hypothetical protein
MSADPAAFVAALKRGERPKKTVSHRLPGNNYLLSNTGLPSGLLLALRGGSPPGLNRLWDRAEFTKELGKTNSMVVALLQEAAELKVEALPAPPAADALRLRVSVTNAGAGHALPTGPLDQRYLWLEVVAKDASGKVVFHQGKFDDVKGEEDKAAVRWMKEVRDTEGKLDQRHLLFDAFTLHYTRKPIAPKATDAVDYDIALPPETSGPLTVTVRLWYRLAVQPILRNIESQGGGKVAVVSPPWVLEEASVVVPSRSVGAQGEPK